MKFSWILPAIGVVAIIAAAGCEDDAKLLVGAGGACASIVNCEPGLSCVATGREGRSCRSASTPLPGPAPEDGAAPDAAAPDATTEDANAPDTSDGEAPDAQIDAADGDPTTDGSRDAAG